MGCTSSTPLAQPIDLDHGFHKSYRIGQTLGEGSYGQVRAVTCTKSEATYAAKILDMRGRDGSPFDVDRDRARATKHEISVWKRVGEGEHVVQLFQTFMDYSLCYMVMERCSCSLMDKIAELSANDMVLTDVFTQMLQGISHVHKKGVVHRDIKPDNFLFGNDQKTLKLGDFGLAKPLTQHGVLTEIVGTAAYMSPEMVARKGYTSLTDVWSFGACAYLMVFGCYPYMPQAMTPSSMKDAIATNSPKLKFDTSRDDPLYGASEFVAELLKRSASRRLSAEAALELEFLSQSKSQVPLFVSEHVGELQQLPTEGKSKSQDGLLLPEDVALKRNESKDSNSTMSQSTDADGSMDSIDGDLSPGSIASSIKRNESTDSIKRNESKESIKRNESKSSTASRRSYML